MVFFLTKAMVFNDAGQNFTSNECLTL